MSPTLGAMLMYTHYTDTVANPIVKGLFYQQAWTKCKVEKKTMNIIPTHLTPHYLVNNITGTLLQQPRFKCSNQSTLLPSALARGSNPAEWALM